MEGTTSTGGRLRRKATGAKNKTLPCPHCNRLFARLEHLQRHVRTHTKEKPFACEICSKCFARSDLLVRHERLVHPADGGQQDNRAPDIEVSDMGQPPALISPHAHHDTQMIDSMVDPELNRSPQATRASMSHLAPQVAEIIDTPQFNPSWGYDLNLLSHAASHVALGGHTSIHAPIKEETQQAPVMQTNAQFQEKMIPEVVQPLQPPGSIFENGDLADPLQDFTLFLDSVGLSSDWHSAIWNVEETEPSFLSPNYPLESRETHLAPPRSNGEPIGENRGPLEESNSFSQFGSRLPSLQPEPRDHDEARSDISITAPKHPNGGSVWDVTDRERQQFVANLQDFAGILPFGFNPPSRHTLARYFAGYVNGFHEHLPFIHIPTLSAATWAPELILALAAVGAQYRFENARGMDLFFAAKAVALEQVRRRDKKWIPQIPQNLRRSISMGQSPHGFAMPGYSQTNSPFQSTQQAPGGSVEPQDNTAEESRGQMDTVRALLLLTAFGTWERNLELLREALGFQSVLARLTREHGLDVSGPPTEDMTWEEWISYEGDKRTKLITYCFLNIHSIIWNVSPPILSREVKLALPDPADQWKAPNAMTWRKLRRNSTDRELSFQETFTKLFQKNCPTTTVSPVGNYVLIHALIQQIFFARQICSYWPLGNTTIGSSLRPEDLTVLEHALASWKSGWRRTPESSLDPQNPNGPVAFTSTALLGLAYIRLHVDLGPCRHLDSRDPLHIAAALKDAPPLIRSPRLIMALLHSAHALSIPIRLGIDFVAKSQTFFWSLQHSVCSLECAYLLSKWLATIPATQAAQPLSEHEQKLLLWVRSMLDETEMAVSPDADMDDTGPSTSDMPTPTPFNHPTNPTTNTSSRSLVGGTISGSSGLGAVGERRFLTDGPKIKKLSIAVVRVWAKTFKGNTSWAIVELIGSSLDIYADLLEREGL